MPSKICPNCGNHIPDDAKFCEYCGNKFINCPSDGFRTSTWEIADNNNVCPDPADAAVLLIVIEVLRYLDDTQIRKKPVFVGIHWDIDGSVPANMYCPECGTQDATTDIIEAGKCLNCEQRLHVSVLYSGTNPDFLVIAYVPDEILKGTQVFNLLRIPLDYIDEST